MITADFSFVFFLLTFLGFLLLFFTSMLESINLSLFLLVEACKGAEIPINIYSNDRLFLECRYYLSYLHFLLFFIGSCWLF